MAKKKVVLKKQRVPKAIRVLREQLQGPELGNFTGAIARHMTGRMRAETGDEFVTSLGQARGLMIGISVPSLAFEYLIRMNILPLGKLMMLVGIEKVGKSAFLFELVRWFRKYHGFGMLLEDESKFSADWASSIIGWDEPDALIHVPCDSIEDWQKALTNATAWVKKEMIGDKKNPRPGKTWPFIIGVDSIMGKSTKGTQKKIEDSGHSEQHFAHEAGRITDYMRFIPQKIARWPFLLVGVNHLKPTKDPRTGALIRQMAGGRGVNFQESLELEIKWGKEGRRASCFELVDREGMRLRLSCANNSYAKALQEIDVTIWMWQEEFENRGPDEDDWRPITIWDWHGATVSLLLREYAGKVTTAKQLKEVVNIQKVTSQSLFYARALGVPKSDPQPADVIGKMIYEDHEMMRALRKIFRIRTYPVFQSGVDFDEQLATQKKRLMNQQVSVKKGPTKKRLVKKKQRVTNKPVTKSSPELVPPPASAKKRKPRDRYGCTSE